MLNFHCDGCSVAEGVLGNQEEVQGHNVRPVSTSS